MTETWRAPIRLLDDEMVTDAVIRRTVGAVGDADEAGDVDPAALILTCLNCGAAMDERKCKLICRCGYFLSCSDYY